MTRLAGVRVLKIDGAFAPKVLGLTRPSAVRVLVAASRQYIAPFLGKGALALRHAVLEAQEEIP